MEVFSTELPSGWSWVTDSQERNALEAEFARELPPQHNLFGKTVRLLARHDRRDDFLFRIDGSEVAQVHLTWSVETDPFFPHAQIHLTFGEWAKTGGIMK